jgi:uncharacterized protein YuzE
LRLRIRERSGAAYLSLHGEHETVDVTETLRVAPPGAAHADERLLLDFDAAGRLVGIEFLVAEEQLLPSVVAEAKG